MGFQTLGFVGVCPAAEGVAQTVLKPSPAGLAPTMVFPDAGFCGGYSADEGVAQTDLKPSPAGLAPTMVFSGAGLCGSLPCRRRKWHKLY